jgi:TonB family protein
MRIFKALIISLFVYAFFIWLYLTYFSKIQIPSPKLNNHVIKIDIRDIPVPAKPISLKAKIKPKEKSVPKKEPVIKKEIVKKVKKKPVKVVKKKPKKKKLIKKKSIKKKKIIVNKKPSKKKVYVTEEVPVKKSKALEEFESEMVYISEPMLSPKNVQPPPVSPWSYPNNKIRELYGAGFHNFTPTQKKFIENNLNSIQEITQRTLTRRGYPEGAGRTGQEGTNVVSFNLHPNGNISNLRLKTRIGYRSLDDNTLSLIRVAYMDYPYPSTTTKIIFYVT